MGSELKNNIEYIKEVVSDFLAESKLVSYVNKTWFYTDDCLVIDLSYKEIKFAYDIHLNKIDTFSVTLVERENEGVVKVVEKGKKEKLTHNVSLSICLASIMISFDNLKNKIDGAENYDVSIIIPVYNREEIILPCIESINNQTIDKSKFEVIFIDDNSSDRTLAAIEYNISKECNYRIIKRKVGSGNASTPRNEGIKTAKGKYVFFLDSDDKVHKDLFKDGIEMAEKNNSDIVYFKIVAEGEREVPIRPYKIPVVDKADVIDHHLMRSLTVFKLFKRSMLLNNNILFNPLITVAEDKIFMVHALSVAKNISILANKDYHTLVFHGDDHLSRKKFPIEDRHFILSTVLDTIYFSEKDEIEKKKLYNGWLTICLEMMEKVLKKSNEREDKKIIFFKSLSAKFKVREDLVDENYVYEKNRTSIRPFINGDYYFYKKDE